MNIKDFKDSLEYLFKAQVTPFVWGHAGIGKSSIVKQYAKAKGFHFFPLYLGTQSDIGDILGLAEFVDNGNGSKSTNFATPKWLNDAILYCNENPDSGAILFLDEFNRARKDVLQGMFSLALDKTFHTIKLPVNCHIVAAGNPNIDGYQVTDVDETALMGRFAHVKLEPTFEEWVEYARATEIEPTLISFYQEQPDLLSDKRGTFELPVKADARAVDRVNSLFKVKTPKNLLEQLMIGIIGLERTVAYNAHLQKQDKPLSGEDVLLGNIDKINVWNKDGDIKSSLITITNDNLVEYLVAQEKQNNVLTDQNESNLMNYISAIPKDTAYVFMDKIRLKSNAIWEKFTRNPVYEPQLIAIVRVAKGYDKK